MYLNNTGEVSQVENVVRFGGSGQEVDNSEHIHIVGAIDEDLSHAFVRRLET